MVAPRMPFDHATRSNSEQPSAEQPGGASGSPTESAVDNYPFQLLLSQISELFEFAAYYLSVRADLIRAHSRRVIIRALMGAIAAIVMLCSVATAVVFLLLGMAGGLAQLFGARQWAGYLATGALLLGLASLILAIIVPRTYASARRKLNEKYERRRQAQQAAFDHDIHHEQAV